MHREERRCAGSQTANSDQNVELKSAKPLADGTLSEGCDSDDQHVHGYVPEGDDHLHRSFCSYHGAPSPWSGSGRKAHCAVLVDPNRLPHLEDTLVTHEYGESPRE